MQRFDKLLKAKEGIAFCYSAEVFAIFIGKTIEDKSRQLIHSLAISKPWIYFQEYIDYPCQTIVVVCFLSV